MHISGNISVIVFLTIPNMTGEVITCGHNGTIMCDLEKYSQSYGVIYMHEAIFKNHAIYKVNLYSPVIPLETFQQNTTAHQGIHNSLPSTN